MARGIYLNQEHDAEQQARGGNGTGVQHPAERQEEKVGNDNQQCRHTDNKLHQHGRRRAEMSLDDTQCGCNGSSCHYGEKRHGKNGSRHSS